MSIRQILRRLDVLIEPRDAWVGVYVGPQAVYVCPVPFLAFQWQRQGGHHG